MNRSQALAIFASMDESKLMDALRAAGVPTQQSNETAEHYGSLEPWNARDVAVPATKRPKLLEQENLTIKMPPLGKGKDYLAPEVPDGYEQYMPQRPDVYP